MRSKEKFERQLELTHELERLLLKKDHEITRLGDALLHAEQQAEASAVRALQAEGRTAAGMGAASDVSVGRDEE